METSANLSADTVTSPAPESNLRILTYNIAYGRGATDDNWAEPGDAKPARIAKIAALLKEIDADIVVLNEVDFDSSWSGRQNQAAAIARQAGYPFRVEQRNFDLAMLFGSWRFGNAILSKFPIAEAELVDFPRYASWESWLAGHKRGVVCEITPTRSEPVRVMAVHLSHRSASLRQKSAEMILQVAKQSNDRLIVAGDLNSTPSGFPGADQSTPTAMDHIIASNQFVTSPVDAPIDTQKTFPSDQPQTIIDWIARQSGKGPGRFDLFATESR